MTTTPVLLPKVIAVVAVSLLSEMIPLVTLFVAPFVAILGSLPMILAPIAEIVIEGIAIVSNILTILVKPFPILMDILARLGDVLTILAQGIPVVAHRLGISCPLILMQGTQILTPLVFRRA